MVNVIYIIIYITLKLKYYHMYFPSPFFSIPWPSFSWNKTIGKK